MDVRVECYSGYEAAERPLRFFLNNRAYTVEEILERWREPAGSCFRVRANDGEEYVLRHSIGEGGERWTLDTKRPGTHR